MPVVKSWPVPEIVLWGAGGSANCLIDVITSDPLRWWFACCVDLVSQSYDPAVPNVRPRGAIKTGAAAEVAALSKERAWTAQAEA